VSSGHVSIDNRAMMAAEPGRAVDQQVPDAVRADMPERHRRAAVSGRSSFGRRIVVRITWHA
jgi:hypothetical protein